MNIFVSISINNNHTAAAGLNSLTVSIIIIILHQTQSIVTCVAADVVCSFQSANNQHHRIITEVTDFLDRTEIN